MSEVLLEKIVKKVLSAKCTARVPVGPIPSGGDFLITFERELEDYFYNLKATTISSMKINKNKQKGSLFELLCIKLLLLKPFIQKSLSLVEEAWLFKDIPSDIRTSLSLTKKDMGIDIVAKTVDGNWIAVQCKYRKKPEKQRYTPKGYPIPHRVGFKDLSTFNSLAERTGPKEGWYRRVVMTNCDSINRQGRKDHEDLSICRKTFLSFGREVWCGLLNDHGYTVGADPSEKGRGASKASTPAAPPKIKRKRPKAQDLSDAEEAREKRQEWLDKLQSSVPFE